MENIIITNNDIIDFYNKYTFLNIENINLMLINIFKSIIENFNSDYNKHNSSDILSNIKNHGLMLDSFKNELFLFITNEFLDIKTINKSLNSELIIIKDMIGKLNNDIISNITSKMFDLRNNLNDDIKLIINNNGSDNLLKIIDNLHSLQNIIIEKVNITINDIIPKCYNDYYNNYNLIISNFKNELNSNINNIKYEIINNKNDFTFDNLTCIFNEKCDNLIDTIQLNVIDVISKSETRLNTNINEIKNLTDFKQILFIINDLNKNIDIIKNNKNDLTILDKLNDFIININHNISKNDNTVFSKLNEFNINQEKTKNELINIIQKNNFSNDKLFNDHENKLFSNIHEIKNNVTNTNSTLINYLEKYNNNSSIKGKFSENRLEILLSELFSNADIIKTTKKTSSCDFILKRPTKLPILIENKDYNTNIPKEEVDKFIYDCEYNKSNGIMISQHSGISNKHNFEIIIRNTNILVFLHKVNYDKDKILDACDIIDNLYNKIEQFNNNGYHIDDDMLKIINEQYQNFINKKNTIIYEHNEYTKKFINNIKELELSEIMSIINIKFGYITSFKCNICNNFNGNNLNELTIHKKNCTIFSCSACNKQYRTKKSLNNHIRSCKAV